MPWTRRTGRGWQRLTAQLATGCSSSGNDLFVTNTERLQRGIETRCGNSILIKLNQIGTLSETMAAIRMAQKAGYGGGLPPFGGTEDTTIADLAVAMGAGADQNRRAEPERTGREIQPPAAYRRGTRLRRPLAPACLLLSRDSICFFKPGWPGRNGSKKPE